MKGLNRIRKALSRWPEFFACMQLTPQWLHWGMIYALRREGAFPSEFRTRQGLRIPMKDWSELTTVWRVFLGNEYAVPEDAQRIVDAGANIGAFSLYMTARSKQVQLVAVEPFPDTFERLQQNINLNQVSDRVRPVQAAMAARKGRTSFDGRTEAHSYCRRIVTPDQTHAITVNALSLGDVLDEAGWEEADYLKMDIEGGEYVALLEIAPQELRRVRAIGLEYHDAQHAPKLFQGLEQAGFKQVSHRPAGWSGLAEFRRVD